jgi:hypothetical protein
VRLGLSRTTLIARLQRLGISRRPAALTSVPGMSRRRQIADGGGPPAALNSAAE